MKTKAAATKPRAPAKNMKRPAPGTQTPAHEGWHGWDDYAPFYDWENARTLGRRDVPFWLRMTGAVDGARPRTWLRHRPGHHAARS